MSKLFLFFAKICIGFCFFINSIQVFAFEISDLSKYQSVAVKTLARNDSLYKNNNSTSIEIQGTKPLINVLGTTKVYYDTQFVYYGENKLENVDETTWYYYTPKSLNGKRKYKLYYRKNDVMRSAYPGDLLVIAKKDDKNIVILIAQKDSKAENEVFEILNIPKPEEKVSFWKKLTDKTEKENLKTINETAPSPTISNKKWMQIYFTPGLDCENNIIAEINKAKKIDIAVYSITNQNIVDAIINAKERGAKIKVITDRLQSKGKRSLIDEIKNAGIPVVINSGHKIMHNKFAVFDDKSIVTGSYNWTNNASNSNAENCIFFNQPDKEYSEHFKYLWKYYAD